MALQPYEGRAGVSDHPRVRSFNTAPVKRLLRPLAQALNLTHSYEFWPEPSRNPVLLLQPMRRSPSCMSWVVSLRGRCGWTVIWPSLRRRPWAWQICLLWVGNLWTSIASMCLWRRLVDWLRWVGAWHLTAPVVSTNPFLGTHWLHVVPCIPQGHHPLPLSESNIDRPGSTSFPEDKAGSRDLPGSMRY